MNVLRTATVWVAAFVLALFLAAFFLTLTAFQLTSDDTGQRILRRAVAISTDIDAVLPGIEADLDTPAADGDSPTITVPDFPIPVELTLEEAATLRGGALRDRILEDAARRLYDDGGSAWAAADLEARRDVERISTPGAIDYGLGFIRDSTNTVLLIVAVLLGIIVVVMAGGLMAVLPWDTRILIAGAITTVAALPSLAGAVALRFVFRTADGEDDRFVEGMLDLGVDAMWVPIRSFLVLSLFGIALILIATLLLWWTSRLSPPGQSALDTPV
ncbi:MAG TPA: hypothetical protein VIW01_04250 [Dehalococcoidia bacterium]